MGHLSIQLYIFAFACHTKTTNKTLERRVLTPLSISSIDSGIESLPYETLCPGESGRREIQIHRAIVDVQEPAD